MWDTLKSIENIDTVDLPIIGIYLPFESSFKFYLYKIKTSSLYIVSPFKVVVIRFPLFKLEWPLDLLFLHWESTI